MPSSQAPQCSSNALHAVVMSSCHARTADQILHHFDIGIGHLLACLPVPACWLAHALLAQPLSAQGKDGKPVE